MTNETIFHVYSPLPLPLPLTSDEVKSYYIDFLVSCDCVSRTSIVSASFSNLCLHDTFG